MIPLFFSSIFSTVLRDFIFADFSKVHVVERERKMCRFVFIFEQKVIERERKTVLEIGIICGRTRSRFSCGVNDATSRWISRFYFFHSRKISIIDISLRLEIIKRYFTRNTNFLNIVSIPLFERQIQRGISNGIYEPSIETSILNTNSVILYINSWLHSILIFQFEPILRNVNSNTRYSRIENYNIVIFFRLFRNNEIFREILARG